MRRRHKERTAFSVGPLGFWEHNRLPFGLSNAPATYQRLMEDCFCELHTKICFIYLDDVIIFSDSFDQHIERLELVLLRLRQCGLKLSPKKCAFLKRKVKYVGHIVSGEGIEADPAKIEKVLNWPRPQNAEEVRQFLGFAGYYRRFVANFSRLARPLTDIMPSTASKTKRKSKPPPRSWHWGTEQEEAFLSLKRILTSPPVLCFPDFARPFELHVDASQKGLGAVLCQEQDGLKRVVYFASRVLGKTEQNYPAHKLEFLALKWAVTEKFLDYLYGQKFTVCTDNNPLTYVLTSAKLDAAGHRWLAALSSFDFDITYRPGKGANADADAMSRHPTHTETISIDSVQAVCHGIQYQPYIETISMSEDVLGAVDAEDLTEMPIGQIRQAQYRDSVLKPWIQAVRSGVKPASGPGSRDHLSLSRQFDRLSLYVECSTE